MTSHPSFAWARVLPVVLAGCVFDCGDDPSHSVLKRSASPPAQPEVAAAAAREPLPKPTGSVTPWESFSSFAPDEFAGATATGPAEGTRIPVPGGGELTAAKRKYEKDGTKSEIEIVDALYAPAVRQIVRKLQQSDRSNETTSIRGTRIGEHPAIVQWVEKTKSARVSVLLADRYIVNVVLAPAASAQDAVKLASTVALDQIAKVEPPATPPSAAPIAPGAAPSGADDAPPPVPGEQVAPARPAP